MIFIFTEKPKKEEILMVLKYIDDFVENIGGGESYWIAPNGERFKTDVGYGIEFWEQVSDYLRREEVKKMSTTAQLFVALILAPFLTGVLTYFGCAAIEKLTK